MSWNIISNISSFITCIIQGIGSSVSQQCAMRIQKNNSFKRRRLTATMMRMISFPHDGKLWALVVGNVLYVR